jgi:hypothetical protein
MPFRAVNVNRRFEGHLDFLAHENEGTTNLRNDGNYLHIDTMLTTGKVVRPQFSLLDTEVVNNVSKMEIRLRRNDCRLPILYLYKV